MTTKIIRLVPGSITTIMAKVNNIIARNTKMGAPFHNIHLSDTTKEAWGVVWHTECLDVSQLKCGETYFFKVLPQKKGEWFSLNIKGFEPLPAELAEAEVRKQKNIQIIKNFRDSMNNDDCRSLLTAFLADKAFTEKFAHMPASKGSHHAYAGGLLEHTTKLMVSAEAHANIHAKLSEVRDVLLLGAFLHDAGKVLAYETQTMSYTVEGQLYGHPNLGVQLLEEKAMQLGTHQEVVNRIAHMILSHHSGGTVKPSTIEAIALNAIDSLDSRLNVAETTLQQEAKSETWSPFEPSLGVRLYKRPIESGSPAVIEKAV